jgi:hypothetical protein
MVDVNDARPAEIVEYRLNADLVGRPEFRQLAGRQKRRGNFGELGGLGQHQFQRGVVERGLVGPAAPPGTEGLVWPRQPQYKRPLLAAGDERVQDRIRLQHLRQMR